MRCQHCSGNVTWQGPLSALTHTLCDGCGRQNCQEVYPEPDDEMDDGEASYCIDTDQGDRLMNTEKGAVMADIQNNQERAAGTVGVSDEALLKTWLACKSIDNRQFCVEFGRAVLTLVDHSSAMEKIAQQWDGCFCEIASVGQVDIGAAIRSDWEQYNHLAATSTTPADEVLLRPVTNRCPKCVGLSCLCDGSCSTPPSGAAVKAEPLTQAHRKTALILAQRAVDAVVHENIGFFPRNDNWADEVLSLRDALE